MPEAKGRPTTHGGGPTEENELEVESLLEQWGRPFDLDDGAPSIASDTVVQGWFAAYLRFAASPHAAELISRLNFEIDIRAILPAIHVPSLVLHRAGDRWHAAEEGRYLAEHIPGAEFRLLPGDDHIPWYGDQDELIGQVEEFVTGTRTTAKPGRALMTLLMTDIVELDQDPERRGGRAVAVDPRATGRQCQPTRCRARRAKDQAHWRWISAHICRAHPGD